MYHSEVVCREVRSRVVLSAMCFLITDFRALIFNTDGTVHQKFIPNGQTVNQQFYTDVLWHLQEDVQ